MRVNVKIIDEMALLNKSGFLEVCKLIVERGLKLNFWCYGRIDCTKPEWLELLKKAGINFIALGIESPDQEVRKDVIKGGFKEVKIQDIVQEIRNHDINIAANYIFGLPLDTKETMQRTLDFAIELNSEMCNMYSCVPYPGSQLYNEAKNIGWKLPETYSGYAQHSYDFWPLPTKYVTAEEVLAFRDFAWNKYHTNDKYLDLVKKKFGEQAYNNVVEMSQIKLKRRLLGD